MRGLWKGRGKILTVTSQKYFGGSFEAQKVRTERRVASDGNNCERDNMRL